ncbi:MAG TPA: hypothetical protein VKV39_05745 [Candidatus Sulfotelmatobacter sp.]|nr:hypothetical protein [Candidatus Sulfotelmatobacter sp.]
MLKLARTAMLRITNVEFPRKRWFTAIVLIAVCTLTVSVATRYGFSSSVADHACTSIAKHQTCTHGPQRLLNDAATWMPPRVEVAIFCDPGQYPHIPPSDSPISSVLLEKNLYNRPPPSLLSAS